MDCTKRIIIYKIPKNSLIYNFFLYSMYARYDVVFLNESCSGEWYSECSYRYANSLASHDQIISKSVIFASKCQHVYLGLPAASKDGTNVGRLDFGLIFSVEFSQDVGLSLGDQAVLASCDREIEDLPFPILTADFDLWRLTCRGSITHAHWNETTLYKTQKHFYNQSNSWLGILLAT